MSNSIEGIVFKSTGASYDVWIDSFKVYVCTLRGKFKLTEENQTNPLAVGDRVLIEPLNSFTGVIIDILPRKNYIVRKSTHKSNQHHILASNLDQCLLIVTLKMPRTSTGFIDRFLVTAESFRIPTIIIFNKNDLLNEKEKKHQQELIELYEKIGYKCIITSAIHSIGISDIKNILQEKTTLVVGHSGVGKSTIINRILPELNQKVQSISNFSEKGTHTTTFAEMFALNETSFIIDIPGIKELGLVEMENEQISHYFPEMRALLGKCKFYNCTHLHEPGCAVQEAVAKAEIAESRFKSYISMVANEDNRK